MRGDVVPVLCDLDSNDYARTGWKGYIMPNPRDVFEHPEAYWSFLSAQADIDFEDQFFDRKEVGRVRSNGYVNRNTIDDVVDEITACISAFANSNRAGGLLVLGVSR